MKFIKHYWFIILSCSILFFGFIIFILSVISPRQDLKNRGFIPCTEAMAADILSCHDKGYYGCVLSGIMKGSWCNVTIVAEGIKLWAGGEQKTPWDNYIFTPELPQPDADEQYKQEFYRKNPPMHHDLIKLQQYSNQLDNQLNTIKEQKNAIK